MKLLSFEWNSARPAPGLREHTPAPRRCGPGFSHWVGALIGLLIAGTAGAADVRLPDFGSSADVMLTPDIERRYGEQMLREMRAANLIFDDPQIRDYIEGLGYRLVAQSERPDRDFTFFVLRDESLNAFAMPGGYIGIHAGLITTAETESELAGVIAHEVAHISQRHLARAFESASKSQLPIALAMLGAIVAAQAAGNSSGDLAQAAVVSGSALMQQRLINFTRGNEYEADRIGIQTLSRAGFDVNAMPDFFARMHRANRANGSEIPEFLRTHPVDTTRIAEAKERAAQLAAERSAARRPAADANVALPLTVPKLAVPAPVADRSATQTGSAALPAFLLFRERVRALSSRAPSLLVQDYQRHLEATGESDAGLVDARRYGLGLALVRAGRPEDAVPVLTRLAQDHADSTSVQLALAEAESTAGRHAAAVERVRQLDARRPGERAITQSLATVLLAQSRKEDARQAAKRLKPVLEKLDADASLIETYARASQIAGDDVRAGEMYAELTLLNGRPDDAMGQLRGLLDRVDVDHYQRARIEARIAQITPWALFVQEERRKQANPGP